MSLTAHGREVSLDLGEEPDHISQVIRENRDFYERPLLEDVWNRLKGGVAVDVGAHIGNHSLFFSQVCGMKVFALEPYPPSARRLRENVERNQADVTVIEAAAGATKGRGLILPPAVGNSGTARVLVGMGDTEVIRLDNLPIQKADLIKVDVEGAAFSVLAGARRLLRSRPLLYIEAEGRPLSQIEVFLKRRGYRKFGRFAVTPTWGFA